MENVQLAKRKFWGSGSDKKYRTVPAALCEDLEVLVHYEWISVGWFLSASQAGSNNSRKLSICPSDLGRLGWENAEGVCVCVCVRARKVTHFVDSIPNFLSSGFLLSPARLCLLFHAASKLRIQCAPENWATEGSQVWMRLHLN